MADEVKLNDMRLLVVDKEQRFGVSHKEQIKKMHNNVNVLTLSATPIPRTLEMSLTGIRDLSLLQTPPADRQPILTYVGEYDDRAVAEALRRLGHFLFERIGGERRDDRAAARQDAEDRAKNRAAPVARRRDP